MHKLPPKSSRKLPRPTRAKPRKPTVSFSLPTCRPVSSSIITGDSKLFTAPQPKQQQIGKYTYITYDKTPPNPSTDEDMLAYITKTYGTIEGLASPMEVNITAKYSIEQEPPYPQTALLKGRVYIRVIKDPFEAFTQYAFNSYVSSRFPALSATPNPPAATTTTTNKITLGHNTGPSTTVPGGGLSTSTTVHITVSNNTNMQYAQPPVPTPNPNSSPLRTPELKMEPKVEWDKGDKLLVVSDPELPPKLDDNQLSWHHLVCFRMYQQRIFNLKTMCEETIFYPSGSGYSALYSSGMFPRHYHLVHEDGTIDEVGLNVEGI